MPLHSPNQGFARTAAWTASPARAPMKRERAVGRPNSVVPDKARPPGVAAQTGAYGGPQSPRLDPGGPPAAGASKQWRKPFNWREGPAGCRPAGAERSQAPMPERADLPRRPKPCAGRANASLLRDSILWRRWPGGAWNSARHASPPTKSKRLRNLAYLPAKDPLRYAASP